MNEAYFGQTLSYYSKLEIQGPVNIFKLCTIRGYEKFRSSGVNQ